MLLAIKVIFSLLALLAIARGEVCSDSHSVYFQSICEDCEIDTMNTIVHHFRACSQSPRNYQLVIDETTDNSTGSLRVSCECTWQDEPCSDRNRVYLEFDNEHLWSQDYFYTYENGTYSCDHYVGDDLISVGVAPFDCNCYHYRSSAIFKRKTNNGFSPCTLSTVDYTVGMPGKFCESAKRNVRSLASSPDDSQGSVELSFDGHNITVKLDVLLPATLNIRKGDWSQLINVKSKTYQVYAPDKARISSGLIQVEAVDSSGSHFFASLYIKGKKTCEVLDSNHALDFVTTFNCLYTGQKVFFGLIIAFLSMILIYFMFRFLSYWMKLCSCCIRCMARTQTGTNIYNRIVGFQAHLGAIDRAPLEDFTDEEVVTMIAPREYVPKKRRTGENMFSFIFLAALLSFSFVKPVFGQCNSGMVDTGCSAIIDSSSQIGNCIVTNTGKVCSINLAFNADFQSVDDVLCSTLLTSDNQPLLHFKAQILSQRLVLEPAYQYGTADWTLETEVVKVCPGHANCSLSSCGQETIDGSYGGWLQSQALSFPGESGCLRGSAGINGGCFLATPNCLIYRYGFNPTGNHYDVYSIDEFRIETTLNYSISHPNGSEIYCGQVDAIHGTNTEDQAYPGIKVTISEEEDSSIPDFSGRFICYDVVTQHSYICVASEPNQPVKGTFGEVQFNSGGTNQELLDSMIWDDTLVSVTPGPKSVSFNAFTSSVSPKSNDVALPGEFGGFSFTEYNNQVGIWGYPQGFIKVRATVFSAGAVSVQYDTDNICPEVKLIDVSGCCKCDTAAEITFEGKSTCEEGSATLKSSDIDLVTDFVNLQSEDSRFTVLFNSEDCHPTGSITFYGTDQHITVQISGDLTYTPEIVGENRTSIDVFKDNKVFDKSFVARAVKFKFTFVEWIIFGVILLVGGLILYFSIKACIPSVYKKLV